MLRRLKMDKNTYIEQEKTKVKRMLIILLAVVLAVVLFIFSLPSFLNDNLSKKQIFKLVNDNYDVLTECVQSGDYDQALKIKGIKSTYAFDDAIEFSCGGKGMGSQTSYYGFYYSTDDKLSGLDFHSGVSGYDSFSYKEENGDNSYYTEKICDHFYYYEAHF